MVPRQWLESCTIRRLWIPKAARAIPRQRLASSRADVHRPRRTGRGRTHLPVSGHSTSGLELVYRGLYIAFSSRAALASRLISLCTAQRCACGTPATKYWGFSAQENGHSVTTHFLRHTSAEISPEPELFSDPISRRIRRRVLRAGCSFDESGIRDGCSFPSTYERAHNQNETVRCKNHK